MGAGGALLRYIIDYRGLTVQDVDDVKEMTEAAAQTLSFQQVRDTALLVVLLSSIGKQTLQYSK
jgi:hypothetical protein